MNRLQEMFKTVADISLLQEKLMDAQVELAEKKRLPVSLDRADYQKVEEARRQLTEARQRLLQLTVEIGDKEDAAAILDTKRVIITGRGGA